MGPGLFPPASAIRVSLGDQKQFLQDSTYRCLSCPGPIATGQAGEEGAEYLTWLCSSPQDVSGVATDGGCWLQHKGRFVAGRGRLVAGTCPGIGEGPAALTSWPCPPGSRARARGSRWPARLANIALLMVLLHPCSSALEKGAVVFSFSEKGSIASWGEGGNTMLSAGPFPLSSFVS